MADKVGNVQVFTEGTDELVLDTCESYWAGDHINSMSAAMKEKWRDLFDNAQINDIYCLGFAYRPIVDFHQLRGDSIIVKKSDDDSDNIFLGIATLAFGPKPVFYATNWQDFCDFISDLNTAGVRFTYFSIYAERESKGKSYTNNWF